MLGIGAQIRDGHETGMWVWAWMLGIDVHSANIGQEMRSGHGSGQVTR